MVESFQPTQRPAGNGHSPHDRQVAALLAEQRRDVATFLRICGARQELEDVLQEAMQRAWAYRHTCDLTRSPKAWLRQTAFRCWLDAQKRLGRQPVPIGDHDRDLAAPNEALPEHREQLQHALRHMTELERQILLRFHQHGDSLQELAEAFDMNVNTVKSHLHRARRRLPSGDWS